MTARAPLVELFDSVQGEGRFVGVPMAFVRVATCPLRCTYCDTPQSYEASPQFEVRGRERVALEANPVTAARAVELVGSVVDRSRWIATVTGGEPLVFPEFLVEFAAAAAKEDARVHLETAAVHPDAMRVVAPHVEHVSADWKLPGTLQSGDYQDEHVACIETAVTAGRSVDVKVVLTRDVTDAGFEHMLDRLRPLRRSILLVLQPVTPFGAVRERYANDALLHRLDSALEGEFDVRVIPQTHKALGVD